VEFEVEVLADAAVPVEDIAVSKCHTAGALKIEHIVACLDYWYFAFDYGKFRDYAHRKYLAMDVTT
jgi:hypothetical protein